MKEAFQIWHDVYQIGGSDITGSGDCSVYLVDANSGLVLIDSGVGRTYDRLVKNIEDLGFNSEKLTTIIATHGHIDHIGSLAKFKEEFEVEIIAHELDVERIETGENTCAELYGVSYEPCEVDIELGGEKERIDFGKYMINFLHIPGHTPGSIVCYVEVEGKRVLFGQDIHGPYNLSGSDPMKAEISLQKLIDLHADVLCEGHYGVFQPKEKVEEFIQTHLERLKT